MTEMTTIITNVGFPIACVIAMAWYVNTTVKELTKTVAENTLVIQKFLDKMEDEK